MKIIKFILIFLTINSCASYNSIPGLYGKCDNSFFVCNQLELNPDSTFEFYIFRDVGGANILKGNWEQTSTNAIILNTYNQPKISKTFYTGRRDSASKNNIKIWISSTDSPLAGALISINSQQHQKVADKNGFVEFDASQVESISFQFLELQDSIKIENPDYNEIFIVTKDFYGSSTPHYLHNEVIFIEKGKLIFQGSTILSKTKITNKMWKQ